MAHFFLHNSFQNGDVILSRAVIRSIRETFPTVKLSLECSDSHAYLWEDLDLPISLYSGREYQSTEPTPNCPSDAVFVNLWFGTFEDILSLYGMTYTNHVHTFNRQMYQHDLQHQYLLPIVNYTPAIDFGAKRGKSLQIEARSILVENGSTYSNQNYLYFNEYLQQIVAEFPRLNFYCTAKPAIAAPNLFDCSDLNLIELSKASERCIGLLMQGSAINAATQTEINRYKPRCIAGWNLPFKLWENLENPVVYAENYDRIREFLAQIQSSFSPIAQPAAITHKPRGVFLNTAKANCSIHESGNMAYHALRLSERYDLDYLEISPTSCEIPLSYDFYIFNYHHATMSWLNTKNVKQLPGLKATIVLETLTNNPFVLCPADDFDVYLALDPTMNVEDRRVYALPRPLEVPTQITPYREPKIPIIGSFGFATPGKGFELVIDAVNREFDEALIRINIPSGTYADSHMWNLHKRNYAEYLRELCETVAKPGIQVVVTNDYMTKEELIEWCGQNTLNCFLYNRNQPGLSATTDQAISSGRPLAVSTNETFRHIHRYVTPYPYQSLKESIASSAASVVRMQHDWTPKNFALKLEEALGDFGLLDRIEKQMASIEVLESPKDTILIVSHKQKQCGIYQYGINIAEALQKSSKYLFVYEECSSQEELDAAVAKANPAAIIYNYYPTTMPWLTGKMTRAYPKIVQLGLLHEVTQEEANRATTELFDYHLCPDPTLIENNPIALKTKRLIPPYINHCNLPEIPTIGSFGFGFADKGFDRLISTVQQEFDRAKILLHLPKNDVVGDLMAQDTEATLQHCRSSIYKPGVELVISQDFLNKAQLLDFLAGNTINAFFYAPHKHRGISSVIEHALAVQRPIAITQCGMFRHILNAKSPINIESSSLQEIMNRGIAPLVPFYNEWSEASFILDYERILDRVLDKQSIERRSVSLFKTPIGNYYLPTDISTDVIVNEMKAGRIFEPEVVELAKEYIIEGSTVLDVGANFGQMTLLFSQFTGDRGHVFSFEADDFTFGVLQKNIEANSRLNITAICKAIYDRNGETMFYPIPDFKRFGSFGSYGLDPQAKDGRKVETITIDSLNIQTPISFMKVDCQGSDLFILRGAVETIKKHQMPILFEYEEQFQQEFGTSIEDYLSFIEEVGYKVEKIIDSINYLIVPKHRKKSVPGIENVACFNRILDNAARAQYQPVIEQLFALAPEMMSRKIPEANIQQAFILDTALKFAVNSRSTPPKILCVGSFEDTAAVGLKQLGYAIEEIDPALNYDLNTYFHLPSTIQGSYDIVFSTSVLEHVQDDELFLTQIAQLLAPGGTAILTCDYNDRYQPGDPIPVVDFRLYTQKDFKQRILPLLQNCVLVDDPQWDCPNPDFWYEGCQYTFATLVFQKVESALYSNGKSLSQGANLSSLKQSSSHPKIDRSSVGIGPVGIENVTCFNRILDNAARAQYQPVIEQLFALAPEMMSRKIPEANIQQAFILDTALKFAVNSRSTPPKILCVGSFEDTAAVGLKQLGYAIEEIDPAINYDLNTYFHLPSTIQGSYDIVFSTSVLEHVQDDELFLTQIAQLLAPGGTAILTCDYNDRYQPGDPIPVVDFRLYTQKDFKQRILPLLQNCVLVDDPQWDCPNPDFVYEGCRYTFATFVFQKNLPTL